MLTSLSGLLARGKGRSLCCSIAKTLSLVNEDAQFPLCSVLNTLTSCEDLYKSLSCETDGEHSYSSHVIFDACV